MFNLVLLFGIMDSIKHPRAYKAYKCVFDRINTH